MSTTPCSKCGAIVRRDHPTCPACEAANNPSAQGSVPAKPVPRREDMEIEIRSRLLWGESPEVVRADFVARGVRAGELDPLVTRAVLARKSYYRKKGIQNAALGLGLLVLGLILLLATDDVVKEGPRRISGRIILLGVALPAGGLVLLFKGIKRLRHPGDGERMSGDPELDD